MSIGALKSNGCIAETSHNKAEMLNEQFCSVFTNEDLSNIPTKGVSPYPSTPRIHVTLKGVSNSIKRLNVKKASGPDKIPIIVLKETENEISPILQSLFQQSLDTHKYHQIGNMLTLYLSSKKETEQNHQTIVQ